MGPWPTYVPAYGGDDSRLIKGTFALSFLQPTALPSAKLSVLFLLQRVFVTRRFRLTVRILGAIVAGWWIAVSIAYAIICTPIPTQWDSNSSERYLGRVDLNRYSYIPWVLTDFAILIAPIPVVKSLQLPRGEKILLCALFLTGGLTCIITCVRYSKVLLSLRDITWQTVDGILWAVIETNVTVICACLVAVRPALMFLIPEKLIAAARLTCSKLKSSCSGGRGSFPRTSTPSTSTPVSSRTHMQERSPRLLLFVKPADKSGTQIFHEALMAPLHSSKTGPPSPILKEVS